MAPVLWWVLAATPWQDMSGDVVVDVTVAASPEEVTTALSNLDRASLLFSEECLARWALGVPHSGVGAMARVTYTPHWMNRRLTLTVTDVRPGERVDWDHAGDKGFLTRYTVKPEGTGSQVSVLTSINPPPWPFAKLYQLHIKTAWEVCYLEALRKLDER